MRSSTRSKLRAKLRDAPIVANRDMRLWIADRKPEISLPLSKAKAKEIIWRREVETSVLEEDV